jgi:hypothetical protein
MQRKSLYLIIAFVIFSFLAIVYTAYLAKSESLAPVEFTTDIVSGDFSKFPFGININPTKDTNFAELADRGINYVEFGDYKNFDAVDLTNMVNILKSASQYQIKAVLDITNILDNKFALDNLTYNLKSISQEANLYGFLINYSVTQDLNKIKELSFAVKNVNKYFIVNYDNSDPVSNSVADIVVFSYFPFRKVQADFDSYLDDYTLKFNEFAKQVDPKKNIWISLQNFSDDFRVELNSEQFTKIANAVLARSDRVASFLFFTQGNYSNATDQQNSITSVRTILNQTTCDTLSFSSWARCENGFQKRDLLFRSPSGCQVEKTQLTQSCK